MANTKLPIHMPSGSTQPEDHVLMLGEAYVKRWKIPVNSFVTVRYGSFRKEMKIVSVAHLAALRINDSLGTRLGLHHGSKLCLSYKSGTRTLSLAPLIGVLVSRVYSRLPDRPFGAMTAFCKEMTEAAESYGGFVYFFTPEDITSGASTVAGWTYDKRWLKRTFPVPDVVYNLLPSRKLESKPIVKHFVKEVKSRYGTSFFNEQYLSKTDVFQALRNEPGLQGYLPESYSFKNFAMLRSMCKKYAIVFLKPNTGSLGKGIIKIVRHPDQGYLCYFTGMNGLRKQTYPTLPQLFHAITGKMKQYRYQIQQGLRLIEAGGRPVDFRALVQRNNLGQWSITSVVSRIAVNNTFVSNLDRGDTLSSVTDVLNKSNLPYGTKAGINVKLRKAALNIAKGIEHQIPAHFGELGVDLAVDTGGRVWLLEVNSKLSKDDNSPPGGAGIRPSVKKLVIYSQYLAGV